MIGLLLGQIRQLIHQARQRAEYGREIAATLSQQLSSSHFREILLLTLLLQRDYYAQMCRIEC